MLGNILRDRSLMIRSSESFLNQEKVTRLEMSRFCFLLPLKIVSLTTIFIINLMKRTTREMRNKVK